MAECTSCKGHGHVRGTEVWGKETDRCGGYTMEIMEADDCEDCGGTGIVRATCWSCDEKHDADLDICPHCDEGRQVLSFRTAASHTARKTFKGYGRREVRPGDRYRRTVEGGYYFGGARWLEVTRTRLTKGPAWA